jgi:zinc transporter ZupT
MFLPPQYFWLEPVLFAAVIVFVVDLIGNLITFSNRFANALVTAILFAGLFGALVYYGYGNVQVTVNRDPSAAAPAKKL